MLKYLLVPVCLATPLVAEVPTVVTDIAPVHSLVAQVMEGAGTPTLLIDASGSPHDGSLRPSQAAAVQEADIAFIIGSELTPWLTNRLGTIAPELKQVSLLELSPMLLEAEAGHIHGDEHHEDEHHEEEHHDDDDHAEEDGHDEHFHDPHAWLSPENASAWLVQIADVLADSDPEHAELYQDNASKAADRLATLESDLTQELQGLDDRSYLTYHDAYSYFGQSFGLMAAQGLTTNEAAPPSASAIQTARDQVAEGEIGCFFTEAQYGSDIANTIAEAGQLNVSELDPLGAALEPGPALYEQVLRQMGTSFADCLKG